MSDIIGSVIGRIPIQGQFGKVEPPPPPPSPPVFDALYYIESQGNNPIEYNHTVAVQANRLMIYCCGIRDNQQITSVTFNGDSFTKLLHHTNGSDTRAEIWYLLAPDTGTHQVVVTSTNNDQVKFSYTLSFYNVKQTDPFGTPATNTGSGTASSIAAVTSDIYAMVVDVCSRRDGGTPAVVAGQTLRRGYSGGSLHGGVSTKPGEATSVSMGWTGSDQPWSMIGVAVNGN